MICSLLEMLLPLLAMATVLVAWRGVMRYARQAERWPTDQRLPEWWRAMIVSLWIAGIWTALMVGAFVCLVICR